MSAPFNVDVPVGYSFGATPDGVRGNVDSESGEILGRIKQFEADAISMVADANTIISSVKSYAPPTIGDINFTVNFASYDALEEAQTVDSPNTYKGGLDLSPVGDAPSLSVSPFISSQFRAPKAEDIDFGKAPSAPADIALPTEYQVPADTTLPSAPLPFPLTAVIQPLGQGPTPPGDTSLSPVRGVGKPIFSDVKLADFSNEADKFRTALNLKFERIPYLVRNRPLVRRWLATAESLAAGQQVVDVETTLDGEFEVLYTNHHLDHLPDRMGAIWAGREDYIPTDAQASDAAVRHGRFARDIYREEFDLRKVAQGHRWDMSVVKEGIEQSVAAHGFIMEVLGELYDADFELLMAYREALLGLFDLAQAEFESVRVEIEKRAAEYRGELAQAEAQAAQFEIKARRSRIEGQIAGIKADSYAAQNIVKGAAAATFSSAVDYQRARVRVYDAKVRSEEAKLDAKAAELAKYQAQVASWEAGVTRLQNEYAITRSKNAAVVAENRAIAAAMGAEALSRTETAQQARQSAIQAVSASAMLRAEISNRLAEYSNLEAKNRLEGARYQEGVISYAIDAITYSVALENTTQMNRNRARKNAGVASSTSQAGQAAIQAVRLAQQYRSQLVNAYKSLYDMSGGADASRLSGELSRHRATVGLSAEANLSYSSSIQHTTAFSEDVTNSGTNRISTEWEAAKTG